MIVLIDNFDSFTYNLYDYLMRFDDCKVILNTATLNEVKAIKDLKGIVISPGPSHPKNSMLSLDVINAFSSKTPILGVCLGMQAICFIEGNVIRRAKNIMHGKVDLIIKIDESPLFNGIDEEFLGVRYHSLVVDKINKGFKVTAISKTDEEIMAIQNINKGIYGLQFHPESYETRNGLKFIENFVRICNENV